MVERERETSFALSFAARSRFHEFGLLFHPSRAGEDLQATGHSSSEESESLSLVEHRCSVAVICPFERHSPSSSTSLGQLPADQRHVEFHRRSLSLHASAEGLFDEHSSLLVPVETRSVQQRGVQESASLAELRLGNVGHQQQQSDLTLQQGQEFLGDLRRPRTRE